MQHPSRRAAGPRGSRRPCEVSRAPRARRQGSTREARRPLDHQPPNDRPRCSQARRTRLIARPSDRSAGANPAEDVNEVHEHTGCKARP
jgi:hypothetical protein